MSTVDFYARSPVSLYVTADEEFIHDEVISSVNSSQIYELEVPRTELNVIAWSGCEDYVSEHGLAIPLGYDCPPVYIHATEISATGEVVCDTVVLRKNHCVLRINFMKQEELCALTLRGAVSGFDWKGNPKPGDFNIRHELDTLSTQPTQILLPRQIGDPLYLDVLDVSGKVKTFPLHEYISLAGYDWTDPDLKDLSLTLNYTLTAVSLVILGWDEEFIFDVVI